MSYPARPRHSVLHQAVVFDTETTGLHRGAGIREMALYDMDKRIATEWVLDANAVTVQAATAQDRTGLASAYADDYIRQNPSGWHEVVNTQLRAETGRKIPLKNTMVELEGLHPWLFDQFKPGGKNPLVQGPEESAKAFAIRAHKLKAMGIKAVRSPTRKVQAALGEVQQAIRGKVLWIANAPFESKIVGAHMAAMSHPERISDATLLGHDPKFKAVHDRRVIADAANAAHRAKIDFPLNREQFLDGGHSAEQMAHYKAGEHLQVAQRRAEMDWVAARTQADKSYRSTTTPSGEFKSQFETWNPRSPDPMYVTGKEVTRSRVVAQQDGDWTRVWKAYKAYGPKAGETAVRDIQDVLRAVHSYGNKLGLTSHDFSYAGTNIDVSARLWALANETPDLLDREAHRALEDAAKSEAYVLENAVWAAQDLQDITEGTARGSQLLSDLKHPDTMRLGRYFQALEEHGPALFEEQVTKRVHRGYQDLAEEGVTHQTTGATVYTQEQLTPTGSTSTFRQHPVRTAMHSMEEQVRHLDASGQYGHFGASATDTWSSLAAHADDPVALGREVYARTQALQESWPTTVGDASARLRRLGKSPFATGVADLAGALGHQGGKVALAAATLAFMGGVVGLAQRPPEQQGSLTHYGYRDWNQRNQIEGMSSGTVASEQRHAMTDFGSPYRGPVGVEKVFFDQELLRERERWMRSQYGVRHYDPEQGVFQPFKGFQFNLGRQKYIQGAHEVQGEQYGLRGNLMAIDMENGWKMEAEDADTVVVKRGGVRGAISSFFGLNRGYSFRLAGLDSPETSHGSTSYHAPQPGADDSTNALKQILASSGSTKLVFDPTQITYGRMMGAVVADGRNVNFDLVRRGIAARLPFGKWDESIIDYGALKGAEVRAYENRRGIWAHPWARGFYEHSEASGARVTFNTLAKIDSIVQNSGNMAMLSMMEQAQRNAQWSERDTVVARELGSNYHVGKDSVGPAALVAPSRPTNSYLHEQLQDLAGFTRTRGRGGQQNKFKASNMRRLDSTLVLDTLGTSDNVWTRRKYGTFETYESTKALSRVRKERMAAAQRNQLRALNASPIGHTRM